MHKLETRKQIRLKNYNYSEDGCYFITICAKNRDDIFGQFVGAPLACALNNIKLSILGQLIREQWFCLAKEYNNVELDEFVIMPNHIHGILIINNMRAVNNIRAEASAAPTTIPQIIRSFKSKSTMKYLKYINDNNLDISAKIWQRSFYDHIIRNEHSLNAIRKYISHNPENWEHDIDNLVSP